MMNSERLLPLFRFVRSCMEANRGPPGVFRPLTSPSLRPSLSWTPNPATYSPEPHAGHAGCPHNIMSAASTSRDVIFI